MEYIDTSLLIRFVNLDPDEEVPLNDNFIGVLARIFSLSNEDREHKTFILGWRGLAVEYLKDQYPQLAVSKDAKPLRNEFRQALRQFTQRQRPIKLLKSAFTLAKAFIKETFGGPKAATAQEALIHAAANAKKSLGMSASQRTYYGDSYTSSRHLKSLAYRQWSEEIFRSYLNLGDNLRVPAITETNSHYFNFQLAEMKKQLAALNAPKHAEIKPPREMPPTHPPVAPNVIVAFQSQNCAAG